MNKFYVVEKKFDYMGLKCIVVFNKNGIRCGYVGVPASHPLYEKEYDDELFTNIYNTIESYFDCHGGITFTEGGKNSNYPIESDLWWFGFDCGHYEDGNDYDLAIKLFPEYASDLKYMKMFNKDNCSVRSLWYVENEYKKLAKQLVYFTLKENK